MFHHKIRHFVITVLRLYQPSNVIKFYLVIPFKPLKKSAKREKITSLRFKTLKIVYHGIDCQLQGEGNKNTFSGGSRISQTGGANTRWGGGGVRHLILGNTSLCTSNSPVSFDRGTNKTVTGNGDLLQSVKNVNKDSVKFN